MKEYATLYQQRKSFVLKHLYAAMAKLVDALDSGSSELKLLEVQVFLAALYFVAKIIFLKSVDNENLHSKKHLDFDESLRTKQSPRK